MMESSDSESFQRQALPIMPLDKHFDPTKAPETGEQYLQHVLYERKKKCADIVTVPMPPPAKKISCRRIEKVFLDVESSVVPPEQKHSTIEWQAIQIENFSALREQISGLRKSHVAENNSSEMLQLPDIEEKDQWEVFCKNNQPLVRIVTSVRVQDTDVLLEYLQSWLQEVGNDDASKAWITLWIYACLAYVFVPLEPNVCSVMREIAKTCRLLRNSNVEPEQNISYSLLICLISSYFRQLDLSDTFNG